MDIVRKPDGFENLDDGSLAQFLASELEPHESAIVLDEDLTDEEREELCKYYYDGDLLD